MVAIVNNEIDGPCTHAFVLGVSRYRHLADGAEPTVAGAQSGLAQLSSAARSASEFAAWLLKDYGKSGKKLGSVFFCAAPAADEVIHADVAAHLNAPPDALRQSVLKDWRAFRKLCLADRAATAIVYVAGHGVQLTKQGATLLLEDFGGDAQEATLWAALDMRGLHASLNGEQAAAHQFWFVDSCRERPAIAGQFETMQGAYRGDEPFGRCVASPLFLAAGPRERAWARVGGVSLFNEALLACLRGAAAVGPRKQGERWQVTTASLAETLLPRIQRASGSAMQIAELTGHVGTTAQALCSLEEPPAVSLTLTLDPDEAHANSRATLSRGNEKIVEDADDWPLVREVAAGLYIIKVTTSLPFSEKRDALNALPPEYSHSVEMDR